MDIPLLCNNKYKKVIEEENNNISLVYTGSMHRDTANPEYLLKLLPKIENVRLYIYGNISDEIKNKLTSSSLYNRRIFLMGLKAHDEILRIQKEADILLNFGNSNPNMIPCKIFEYMGTGNNIISFTHSESDSSLPYMKKYPASLIVKEDENLINENINSINGFIKERYIKTDYFKLEEIFEKNTPNFFYYKLMEL